MFNKIIAYSYFSYQFEKLENFILLLNISCLVFMTTMLEWVYDYLWTDVQLSKPSGQQTTINLLLSNHAKF